MQLLTLLLFVLFAVFVFLIFCKGGFTEMLTPNPYVISWEAPTYSGGDSSCCSYEWQICSDETCLTIVDSGKVAKGEPLTASTTKLDWQNTYHAWVRANNSAGLGEWTKLTFKTGDGVIDEVVIAEEINPDGTISIPLTTASTKISIWSKLSGAPLTNPNAYLGISYVTINRLVGTGPTRTQVRKFSVPLTAGLLPNTGTATSNIFYGTYSMVYSDSLQTNDSVDIDIYISQVGTPPEVTETTSTFAVIVVAPGSVTSLKTNYTPPIWSSVSDQISSLTPAGPSVSGITRDKCQELCTINPDCKFFWYDNVLNKCDQQAITPTVGSVAILATSDPGPYTQYKIFNDASFAPIVPNYLSTANSVQQCIGAISASWKENAHSGNFTPPDKNGNSCFVNYSHPQSATPNVRTYIKP